MSYESTPQFQSFHKSALLSFPKYHRWMWLVYVSILSTVPLAFWVFSTDPLLYAPLFELGKVFGNLAVLFFCLSLTAGVLKRFGILPLTRTLLMKWRRSFGVTMFLLVVAHMFLTRNIPLILTNPQLLQNAPLSVSFGMFAYLLLIPVWVTSNDFSVQRLGKYWGVLHRLVYLVLILAFLHVLALAQWPIQILLGSYFLLELSSWIFFWQKKLLATSAGKPQPPRAS